MKTQKIYLDTSVISYLDQSDSPERMAETHKLWAKILSHEFEVIISDITEAEIQQCNEEKRAKLFNYLRQIPYTVINANEKTIEIAKRIIELGVLKETSFDDCQHIASAIVGGCDIVVSWNFKHIVNYKTINGVKAITAIEGYQDILIYPPSMLIEGE